MGNFLRFWFPVIVYSGIIFYVSGRSHVGISVGIPYVDKVVHIIEYIPLGFLSVRALFLGVWGGFQPKKACFFGFVFVFLYALSDEYHQSFVPGRESDWADCLADTIGGMIGIWIYFASERQFRKKAAINGKEESKQCRQ